MRHHGFTGPETDRLTMVEIQAIERDYREEQRMHDRRAARIQATLAEIHRDRKKRRKPFSEGDFLPWGEERKPSPAVVEERLKNWAAYFRQKFKN